MNRYEVWYRKQIVVNTDPQRRCYDGCNFSEKTVWTEWAMVCFHADIKIAEHWVLAFGSIDRGHQYKVVPVHDEVMSAAVAELVRNEGDPEMTPGDVRRFGRGRGLSPAQVEVLVEIAEGPIGY